MTSPKPELLPSSNEDIADGESTKESPEQPERNPQIPTIFRLRNPEPDIPRPLTLTSLPPRVHFTILTYLGSTASACLGVTCNKFYELHVRTYKLKVPLRQRPRITEGGVLVMKKMLWNYLTDWMKAAGLVYDHVSEKFVTKERMAEFNKERTMDTGFESGFWV